jgi:hypothetical protein
MASIAYTLILIIALFFLIVSAFLSVYTASNTNKLPGFKDGTDKDLVTAHTYATWASILCWIGIAVIAILLLFSVFTSNQQSFLIRNVTYISIIIAVILIITSIFLTISASINLVNSQSGYSEDKRVAIIDSMIASLILLFSLGLVGMFFVGIYFDQSCVQKIKQIIIPPESVYSTPAASVYSTPVVTTPYQSAIERPEMPAGYQLERATPYQGRMERPNVYPEPPFGANLMQSFNENPQSGIPPLKQVATPYKPFESNPMMINAPKFPEPARI